MKNELKKDTESTNMIGIEITFPDELKKGVYSNNIFIHTNPEEITIDFINVIANTGSVVSRTIISPSHAKRFAKVLTETIRNYEERYGEIPEEIKEKNS